MISIAIKRTGPLDWTLSYLLRSLYTVNPILSPPPRGGGAYLFQAYLRRWGGGLTWDGELIWEGLLI